MFNLNEWIEKRGIFKDVEIEGIALQIVSMTSEFKDLLDSYGSHKELVRVISKQGLSHNRNRIADDSELSKDLDTIFALPEFNVECDQSVREKIAQAVCELSGLDDLLTEQLLKEEEAAEKAKHLNGDDLPDLSTTMGALQDDTAAAEAVTTY